VGGPKRRLPPHAGQQQRREGRGQRHRQPALVGGREEDADDLAAEAEGNLRAAGLERVEVVVGDGTLGLPAHAPFHGIVVSAAAPSVPQPLVEQLADGGLLVHPVGWGGDEIVTGYRKQVDRLVPEGPVTPAHFVRLVGEHGLPEN